MRKKYAVIALSGGMDSTSLLLKLLVKGYKVKAISFNYGQKHSIELKLAKELCGFLENKGFDVSHNLVELKGLDHLLTSSLIIGGNDVPEGHYEEEAMKETFVPNRNKIFSSLIQAVALSIANECKETVLIALGIHAGDHAIYPDCRQSFRDIDYEAFREGNWGSENVNYYTPYINLSKKEVLSDGLDSCESLGLDFKEVYAKTMTSYKPLQIDGIWYSDYKSSSSIERIEAFIELEIQDPVLYADNFGVKSWDCVSKHAQRVISSYKEE